MINTITLKAFKSFVERVINLNSLTLLTGINSSGKSSLIQSILMFEKAFNNEKNVLLEEHGTIKDLRNKRFPGPIELGININDIEYAIQLSEENQERFDKTLFPNLWYISAHRFGPKLNIPIFNNESEKKKIGKNGENVLQCIQYYDVEHPVTLDESIVHPSITSYTLLDNIRAWLNIISPNSQFNYKVIHEIDSSFATFDDFRSTNVGFGLSYILPVITTLLVATIEKNNLVIIENPEAHLHPKGQTELTKLICLCASLGTQVIVETHSDHIFAGIRLFVKNNREFADNVLIHWFELNKDKNTEITSIFLDENGRTETWPEGFFDQFEINSAGLL